MGILFHCEPPSAAHDVVFGGEVVYATVTRDPAAVSEWIRDVTSLYGHRLTVGLDIEWRPNYSRGEQNPAATLQLCVGRCCLIYQLIHSPYFPIQLIQFLSYSGHDFAGIGVGSDLKKLQRDHRIGFNANAVELGKLAAEVYKAKELKNSGLKNMARIVLGKEMEKPKSVTRSRWDERRLTAEQVQYACIDAYLIIRSESVMTASSTARRSPNTQYSVSYGNDNFLAAAAARDAKEVNSWIDETLSKNERRLSWLIVGLDIERSPDYITDCDHSAAVLQLCVGRSCLVYQILQSPTIPRKLREFLGDPGYTFVGAGIKNDVQRLWEDHRLRVANVRELGPWAAHELGKTKLAGAGLDVLAKEVVGEEMKKLEKVNCECEACRWDDKVLTRKQMVCACLDGYFSFEIGRRLSAWY